MRWVAARRYYVLAEEDAEEVLVLRTFGLLPFAVRADDWEWEGDEGKLGCPVGVGEVEGLEQSGKEDLMDHFEVDAAVRGSECVGSAVLSRCRAH